MHVCVCCWNNQSLSQFPRFFPTSPQVTGADLQLAAEVILRLPVMPVKTPKQPPWPELMNPRTAAHCWLAKAHVSQEARKSKTEL